MCVAIIKKQTMTILVDMPEDRLFCPTLRIDVYNNRPVGTAHIGTAFVPLRDRLPADWPSGDRYGADDGSTFDGRSTRSSGAGPAGRPPAGPAPGPAQLRAGSPMRFQSPPRGRPGAESSGEMQLQPRGAPPGIGFRPGSPTRGRSADDVRLSMQGGAGAGSGPVGIRQRPGRGLPEAQQPPQKARRAGPPLSPPLNPSPLSEVTSDGPATPALSPTPSRRPSRSETLGKTSTFETSGGRRAARSSRRSWNGTSRPWSSSTSRSCGRTAPWGCSRGRCRCSTGARATWTPQRGRSAASRCVSVCFPAVLSCEERLLRPHAPTALPPALVAVCDHALSLNCGFIQSPRLPQELLKPQKFNVRLYVIKTHKLLPPAGVQPKDLNPYIKARLASKQRASQCRFAAPRRGCLCSLRWAEP